MALIKSSLVLITTLLAAFLTSARQPDAAGRLYSPHDAVRVALTDARTLPVDPTYIRYLWLPSFPRDERVRLKKTVDFTLNSLGNAKIIKRSVAIPSEDDPHLVRVNLTDYDIPVKAWDDLAERGSGRVPLPDYFFHARVETVEKVYWKGGTRNGKYYAAGYYPEKKKVLAAAPWLVTPDGGQSITNLIKTLQTKNPILEARWFLVYSLWAPRYYAFLGLGNKEGDFEKVALLDRKLAQDAVVKAVADTKIVTLHNRILVRFPTVVVPVGGYYWESIDTDTGVDLEDYLNTLIGFKFKAKEIIARKANGLQNYALSDNKGNLVDVAAINIASDKQGKIRDPQVDCAYRCIVCHDQGIWKIDDKVRRLSRGNLRLVIEGVYQKKFDLKETQRLVNSFSDDPNPIVTFDQASYATAVRACNDLTPQESATNLEEIFIKYYDQSVTIDTAAIEAGLTKKQLLQVARSTVKPDQTVSSLAQEPPVAVSRIPWESRGYRQLMEQVSLRPPPR